MKRNYLDVYNLEKRFEAEGGSVVVVKGFHLTLHEGEFVSIIGHSGCGKSTVLSMVAGLTRPTFGDIVLAGRQVNGPGTDRGVVFQSPCLLHFRTALENVLLGIEQVFREWSSAEQREHGAAMLRLVGLEDCLSSLPGELSAGMRQRVSLARAFALSPKLLLLDEPFGMLDSLTRIELQCVLLDLWRKDRKTALMVTHDVDEALFLSDRIVMMTSGPEARVGEILTVPFERPRHRAEVMEHPEYYALRERLVGFLEDQGRHPGDTATPMAERPGFLGAMRSLLLGS